MMSCERRFGIMQYTQDRAWRAIPYQRLQQSNGVGAAAGSRVVLSISENDRPRGTPGPADCLLHRFVWGVESSRVTRLRRATSLRHSAISHLIQAGVDLPTTMRISGHRSLKVLQRYAHQDDAHVRQAMDKLEARLS